ncbi:hypothetical protein RKD52_001184 [Metabacillus sp. SLBN-84]
MGGMVPSNRILLCLRVLIGRIRTTKPDISLFEGSILTESCYRVITSLLMTLRTISLLMKGHFICTYFCLHQIPLLFSLIRSVRSDFSQVCTTPKCWMHKEKTAKGCLFHLYVYTADNFFIFEATNRTRSTTLHE